MRIANKKQFKSALKIILLSIISIIFLILVSNYLRIEGFLSEPSPRTITLINIIEVFAITGVLDFAYGELKYNAETANLEREEEKLCMWLLSH